MNRLDKAIYEINNQEVPEERIEQAAGRLRGKLFAQAHAAPERLRSCADFQAIIPAYLNRNLSAGRALLLQDHTRECVVCRHVLEQQRSGAKPTLIRPATPPSRTISKAWAIAAMAAVTVGLGAWVFQRTFGPGSAGRIAVENVTGILYLVSDRGSTPVFTGKTIGQGERVRTAKASNAVVRLPDGSRVEMNERSELSVARSAAGTTIRLDRGAIIVQAARQRQGTLNVVTTDCDVAVKGTIFAVDRGTRGSRVSVVEGSVKVSQGSQSQMLTPGQQISTDHTVAATTVRDAVSWSRDSARYLALLGEFSIIKKGLDAMPSQALRHDPKLLPYVSRDTVLYASIPNVSASLAEAERLFRQRLAESEVLRQWWESQQDNKKLEAMIAKLRSLVEYLGDEIVLTIDGDWNGNYTEPMVLAEVKRAGFEAFLNAELRQLALNGDKHVPELVRIQPPAAGPDIRESRRLRREKFETRESARMIIGIKDNLIAVAWHQEQIDALAGRIAEPASDPGNDSLLGNVRKAYDRGAGWLLCLNMEHIRRNSVHKSKRSEAQPQLAPGIDAMRYLIVERRDVAGVTENQATLTFSGHRPGMAGWLAEPSPMGSLDFVSPNATFAVSLALKSPQWMVSDLFQTLSNRDPKFEERIEELRRETGLRLSPSLGEPLGGDIAFAVDGPLLPLPSWKLVVEVYSPDRMQWAIEQMVDAFNKLAGKDGKCTDCQLHLAKEESGGRTYYTLSTDKFAYEVHYVFADGYLIAAPNRSLLTKSIQNRATGYMLSRSESFRQQLPRDGRINFSGLVYHNLGTALAPFAEQAGAISGVSPAQRDSIKALVSNTKPAVIYAYTEDDRITAATTSGFFGFDLSSFALPTLIGRGLSAAGGKQVQ